MARAPCGKRFERCGADVTTKLEHHLRSLIRTTGPISVADYFHLCLADPQYGYYKTHDPFGVDGDFITAPEISQLFGEMIGIFLVHAWQSHGAPDNPHLVEIGPGRGTMMTDILRVIQKLAPSLYAQLQVHLVESSERLQKVQSQSVVEHKFKTTWHDSLETVPEGFTLAVANELFDAIPMRQFVATGQGFRERMVALDEQDNLTFAAGVATLDPVSLPAGYDTARTGSIFELAPARDAIMQQLSERIRSFGGTALIIDYGHMATSLGDTLQAVYQHQFDPPLAHPGDADLTSHVDFEALARRARATGLHINGILPQGDFLVMLGLLERAAALGRNKDAVIQESIRMDVARLAGSGEGKMGELFKVLAVSHPAVDLVPFKLPPT